MTVLLICSSSWFVGRPNFVLEQGITHEKEWLLFEPLIQSVRKESDRLIRIPDQEFITLNKGENSWSLGVNECAIVLNVGVQLEI